MRGMLAYREFLHFHHAAVPERCDEHGCSVLRDIGNQGDTGRRSSDGGRLRFVHLPCAADFAAGTEIATESDCVQTAVPLVKSRRCMVILRLPRSTSTKR